MIEEWWNGRIVEGTQITPSNLSHFFKGWDYKGDGPWYSAVAREAMYRDYLITVGGDNIDIMSFSKQHDQIIGMHIYMSDKVATYHREDGSIFTRKKRKFVVFPPKPPLALPPEIVSTDRIDPLSTG